MGKKIIFLNIFYIILLLDARFITIKINPNRCKKKKHTACLNFKINPNNCKKNILHV